ncbi:MAG: STAS domain-containing protein [Desulfurellaceae bacterium]|nr:STAS domain-containing protein [Desulfurellaceae bacterium]
MGAGIDVQWERTKGGLVAGLVGRIDGGNAEEFQRLLESGIESGDHALILDFEHLSFISSAGLRVSLILARQFSEPGKQFGICTLSGPVREVITISGFDKMIAVYESRAAALDVLTGESSSGGGDQG